MTRKKGPGLSPALKQLVSVVEAALGQVIVEAEGKPLFEAVESVRRHMVTVRTGSGRKRELALADANELLQGLAPGPRAALARAYTLFLELVNQCESAYRTHRLRARWRETPPAPSGNARVFYVLTAHPTESRAPKNIHLMRRARDLLIEALEQGRAPDLPQLRHLLHLVWRTGTHPPHKPTVADEARHLFSLISPPILEELLRLRREGHSVYLRTWVGGDKDGHPGVGPEETHVSLSLSRERLLGFVCTHLFPEIEADVAILPDEGLERAWRKVVSHLEALRTLTIGDGRRFTLLQGALAELRTAYVQARGTPQPRIEDLALLLSLFPGLVVPLELREERGLFGPGSPIADMLHYVGDVARGGHVEWYVRGLVVSMTTEPIDLLEAHAMVVRELGSPAMVPVIPLFELPSVLPRACEILDGALEDPAFERMVKKTYGGRIEVMLGYSDTSKRMGVLASKLAIHDAMSAITAWAERKELEPIFFHGSGGSVGRGGGRFEDRGATWPPGATAVLKETLQGEMVERTLATPEILRSQVLKIAELQATPPKTRRASAATRDLAERAERTYVELVGSPDFHGVLGAATPYSRLGTLKIGSRPVRRASGQKATTLDSLRAIPWVLCWTQTRYLAHAWLGVGTAWRELRKDPQRKAQLLRAARRDPLLRSYIRLLGFTLAKTAPRIWREYVTALVGDDAPPMVARLEQERRDALDLVLKASEGELLADRPWLLESIYLRAPMIHPLNLLQIDVLRRKRLSEARELLFRETVTGIAAGMLTTG